MRNKGLSNQEFLGRVREYLPEGNGICETDWTGECLASIRLSNLEENTFYLFDADAALAFSHTVEDFALDDANGCLLATMQNAAQFGPHRERYRQLATTLKKVELIACGKLPRCNAHLKFKSDTAASIKSFWMVLYEGRKCQAMFLGEQVNDVESFDEKKFTGFYTFNPRIISQAREDMAECIVGHRPQPRYFEQLNKMDRAAKQIKVEFAREKNAMDIAIRKLKNHGKKYRGKHLLADLNKTLERLNRLQTHLPELIVEQQKND